jgi:prolipoprotein diacylglyceryltransferase
MQTAVSASFLRLGTLRVPVSGLCLAIGMVLAFALSQPAARRARQPPATVSNALGATLLAAIFFSRLLLVVGSGSGNGRGVVAALWALLARPALNDTGILLTVLFALLWLRWKRLAVLDFLDAITPSAALLWAASHAGSLLDGTRDGLPRASGTPQPVEALALVAALTLCGLSLWALGRVEPPGRLAGVAVASAGIAIFALDFLRLPSAAPTAMLDPVQWLGLAMTVAGGALILALPRIPGNGSPHAL